MMLEDLRGTLVSLHPSLTDKTSTLIIAPADGGMIAGAKLNPDLALEIAEALIIWAKSAQKA